MSSSQGRKEGEENAQRVDIDGVADGLQHLGDLSGVALSCLHPSQEKGLCHPMRRSDEATWGRFQDVCPRLW